MDNNGNLICGTQLVLSTIAPYDFAERREAGRRDGEAADEVRGADGDGRNVPKASAFGQ